MKRVRISASASWLNSEIKRLMRERDPRIKRIAIFTKDKIKWIAIEYKKKSRTKPITLSWLAKRITIAPILGVTLVKLNPPGVESTWLFIYVKKENQNPDSEVGY